MQRSPEELRSFYLIAINKDSVTSGVGDTDQHGESTLQTHSPGWKSSAAGVEFDSVRSKQGDFGAATTQQHRTFLRNSLVARKGSACQQCRLGTFQCDLQRPSCWKCQRYLLPCHYENDYEDGAKHYIEIEDHIDQDDEPPLWHDSVRTHPYESLEGNKTLHRVEKDKRPPGAGRARLSKPLPQGKRVRFNVDYATKEDEETLLGGVSPTISEIDTASRTSSPVSFEFDISSQAESPTTDRTSETSQIISDLEAEAPLASCSTTFHANEPSRDVSQTIQEYETESSTSNSAGSGVSLMSRTISPPEWAGSEAVRTMTRYSSSTTSEYTVSTISTDSRPIESSPLASLAVVITPPTTGASSSWLPQIIVSSWEDVPKLFQCTFCLKHCIDQSDWEHHEVFHIPQKIWICMPSGPNRYHVCAFCEAPDPDSQHFSRHNVEQCFDGKRRDRTFLSKEALQQHLAVGHNQTEMTPRMHKWSRHPKDDEWYWNCGFCDRLLQSWTDRVQHLGDHFNEGTLMSSWDPLTPPYPLDRTSLNRAAWFPTLEWDARTLWDLEQKQCNWSWTSQLEDQLPCKSCDASFRSEADVKRHEDIWHSRRIVWSCPTIEQIENGILEDYFFQRDRHRKLAKDDACPFCNERFIGIAQSYPEHCDPWDVRVLHLEHGHNFDGCDQPCRSTCAATVMLHLANVHNVSFNQSTFEVLESCRKDERSLEKKLIAA